MRYTAASSVVRPIADRATCCSYCAFCTFAIWEARLAKAPVTPSEYCQSAIFLTTGRRCLRLRFARTVETGSIDFHCRTFLDLYLPLSLVGLQVRGIQFCRVVCNT